MSKKAFITGITGQDGSYLAEFLLKKSYTVIGMMRRSSSFNTSRIDHIYESYPDNFDTKYGDLTDVNSLKRNIDEVAPDEIYNLGAQSHVGVSFNLAENTLINNSISTINILEIIRQRKSKCKFYQASSSEMFGLTPPPQNENSKFDPQSPYAISKISSFHSTKYYRRAFGLFAANGILFNHESPRRGLNFLTRKVTHNLAKIIAGKIKFIELGNLSAKRDWGFSGDYVEAMWKILDYKEPEDFVISTDQIHSAEDFVKTCFEIVGLDWKKFVKINSKKYLRPAEVPQLMGDSSKARKLLGWKPKVKFHELCQMMVESDLKIFSISLEKAKEIAKKL